MDDQQDTECQHKVDTSGLTLADGVPVTLGNGEVHAILDVRCIHCGCLGSVAIDFEPDNVDW